MDNPQLKIKTALAEGREISAFLSDAIYAEAPDDYVELQLLATRIQQCNSDGNGWYGTDLHSKQTGELFNGGGKFWRCCSKLCPSCLADQSRRVRKQIREVLRTEKLLTGEYRKFITLTIPNLGLSITESRRILYRAWSLFRKRKWFKQTILGAFKSEEFTLSKRGYHYHCHLLAKTKYVHYHKFRSEWTECVTESLRRSGHSIEILTSDGLAIANCKNITSLDDAIKEVAKYVTKSNSWKRIDAKHLLDVARISRWPRMFEMIGDWKPSNRLGVASDEEAAKDNKTILDTSSITDGERSEHGWKRKAKAIGAAAYLPELQSQIAQTFTYRREAILRRFPYATLHRLYEPKVDLSKMCLAKIECVRRKREAMKTSDGRIDFYPNTFRELDEALEATKPRQSMLASSS